MIGVGSIIGTVIVVGLSVKSFDRLIIHFCYPIIIGVATIATAFTNSKVTYTVFHQDEN